MGALDRGAVAGVDATAQIADILGLPDQLEDALWRVESAAIAPLDATGGLVAAGMGGSAVGGRLAAAALGPRLRRPFAVADDYLLPPWVGPEHLVVCSSYSGETDETLACYDDAGRRGASRLAVTTGGELARRARRDGVAVIPVPGGFQPRAAVAYSLVSALEAAALAGAAPFLRDEVQAAAALGRELVAEWGPDAQEGSEAKELARALEGTIPVVAGADLTAPVAYRWKCQLNETAAVVAFHSTLPEADHNEIVAWPGAGGLGRFSAVFLEDPDGDPRHAPRWGVTAEVAARGAAVVRRVAARGETRLERLISLVLLGDLVSLYLAVLRGKDPVDVAPIDTLKASLGAR